MVKKKDTAIVSERFKVLKQDLWSMARGLADVLIGTGALYLSDALTTLDVSELGAWAPAVAAALVFLSKAIRKWVSETRYSE